jgi:hypothetical protein
MSGIRTQFLLENLKRGSLDVDCLGGKVKMDRKET